MISVDQATGALLLGLAGAGHCLGMCGGVAAALNLGGQRSVPVTLAYHGGRITSYTLIGALLGFAAGSIDIAGWSLVLRCLAGALLVGMGLYIADWWRGMAAIERAGGLIWRPVQRLAAPLLPVRHWYQSALLGLCWGFLPCGLVYSSLAWAATSADPRTAGLSMFLFGVGTLPAMLAVSLGAAGLQAFLRRRGLRLAIGIFMISAGAWTLWGVLGYAHHAGGHEHGDPAPGQHGHHGDHGMHPS